MSCRKYVSFVMTKVKNTDHWQSPIVAVLFWHELAPWQELDPTLAVGWMDHSM